MAGRVNSRRVARQVPTLLANQRQLTGHETLTLLLQFNRLIRRFRLEDAYLAQVIDVNAVFRQRVGHFLVAAGTGSCDAPRSASASDSDWPARISRYSRYFRASREWSIRRYIQRVEYAVKFAAFRVPMTNEVRMERNADQPTSRAVLPPSRRRRA